MPLYKLVLPGPVQAPVGTVIRAYGRDFTVNEDHDLVIDLPEAHARPELDVDRLAPAEAPRPAPPPPPLPPPLPVEEPDPEVPILSPEENSVRIDVRLKAIFTNQLLTWFGKNDPGIFAKEIKKLQKSELVRFAEDYLEIQIDPDKSKSAMTARIINHVNGLHDALKET